MGERGVERKVNRALQGASAIAFLVLVEPVFSQRTESAERVSATACQVAWDDAYQQGFIEGRRDEQFAQACRRLRRANIPLPDGCPPEKSLNRGADLQ